MKILSGTGRILIEEFAALMEGVISGPIDTETLGFTHICTDSREADGDTLFVAMRGERVDGHDYMLSAAKLGCRCFLCQQIPAELVESGLPFAAVTCENSEKALGKFIGNYMEFRPRKTIAVTGSVGKTTTKEFIAAALSCHFSVHKTAENHNSTLGMPLSLLAMSPEQNVMVAEMGMSGFGEISYMSKIAVPDIACITNIGSSHLEQLGTRENICRAKLEILDGMKVGGLLIVNGDEPLLGSVCKEGIRKVSVALSNRDADYRAENLRFDEEGTLFDLVMGREKIYDIRLSVLGRQYVMAALFAIAVGVELGLPVRELQDGLCRFENAAMRQHISEQNGITIIEDCYNASPESMRSAADLMRILDTGRESARLVAVLGDMRELGERSAELHYAVGRHFARCGTSLLFTVGPLAVDIARGAIAAGLDEAAVTVCTDIQEREQLGDAVLNALSPGDILLVKASRAVGAEHLLAYIREKL